MLRGSGNIMFPLPLCALLSGKFDISIGDVFFIILTAFQRVRIRILSPVIPFCGATDTFRLVTRINVFIFYF